MIRKVLLCISVMVATKASRASPAESLKLPDLKPRNSTSLLDLAKNEKYLVYCGSYGRWGNKIYSLQGIMDLAELLGRSVILTKFFNAKDQEGKVVEYKDLLDLEKTEMEFKKSSERAKALRFLDWDEFKATVNGNRGLLPRYVYVSRHYKSWCFNEPEFNKLPYREIRSTSFLKKDPARIVLVSGEIAFFSYFLRQRRRRIYVKEEHWKRVREYLGEKGFKRNGRKTLGLHIRRGDLKDKVTPLDSYLRVARRISKERATGDVFIATDGGSEDVAKMRQFFPQAIFGTGPMCHEHFCPLYDQLALALTDVFVGTRLSTFSKYVTELRLDIGMPRDSSMRCCR